MGRCPGKGISNLTLLYHTLIYMFLFFFRGVEGRSPEFQEHIDLRSNPFQGGGDDAIQPPKGIGQKTPRRLGSDVREGPTILMSLRVDFGPMD